MMAFSPIQSFAEDLNDSSAVQWCLVRAMKALRVYYCLPPLTLPLLVSALHTELCNHNKLTAALTASQSCGFDSLKRLVRRNEIQPQDLIGKYPLLLLW